MSDTDQPRQAHTGPLDFGELAHGLAQKVIEKADPEAAAADATTPNPPSPSRVAAGRKGGRARAAALTPAERSAIAAKGGEARRAAEGTSPPA